MHQAKDGFVDLSFSYKYPKNTGAGACPIKFDKNSCNDTPFPFMLVGSECNIKIPKNGTIEAPINIYAINKPQKKPNSNSKVKQIPMKKHVKQANIM